MSDFSELIRDGWTVRCPSRGFGFGYVGQLFRHRELLLFLGWRDVKIKSKQMLLGMTWTVLQPVVHMVLFSVLLGRFAGLPSERGVPYPLLVFAGLLPWQYFAASVSRAATSLMLNQSLITKVTLPRLVLPAAALLPGLADMAAAVAVMAALMWWYGVAPAWTVVFLPVFLLAGILTAMAAGVWLSGMSARYRDVPYLLPFVLQVWMLVTPVGYSVAIVPPGVIRTIYELNPLAVVVRGVRWSLFGTLPPQPIHSASMAIVIVVLIGGIAYFRHVERTVADVL